MTELIYTGLQTAEAAKNIKGLVSAGIDSHSAMIVAVTALVTAFIRFLPFVVFKDRTPKPIVYLGQVLPFAIMGMLLVYCLKGISFASVNGFMPSAVSLLFIFILHKWKHNTLLSILLGTVCYMVLVQKVFV